MDSASRTQSPVPKPCAKRFASMHPQWKRGKADILGLWMIISLYEDREITEGDVRDNYVTFLASVFRSVRFGASSAHGKANMVRFRFFEEQGAFTRDEATGRYRVDFDKMKHAVASLSQLLLSIQGDGDYQRAANLINEKGIVAPSLQTDLAKTRRGVHRGGHRVRAGSGGDAVSPHYVALRSHRVPALDETLVQRFS